MCKSNDENDNSEKFRLHEPNPKQTFSKVQKISKSQE